MRGAALAVLALPLVAGCGMISFRKAPTDDELRLQREVRGYYTEVREAFATGNAQMLVSLFDTNITQPMTKPDIEKWAADFFGKHGRASFKITALDIEELAYERAVVSLRYRVETPDGQGGFAGSEIDTLIKRHGRWYTARWQKAD